MPSDSRLHRELRFGPQARAQLTLVEHALCPLDSGVSLTPGFRFETRYAFSDRNRNRKQALVRVGALDGLSAHDELYLWGLLSLALSQADPRPELMATPYWCLRQMGIIDGGKRGGREFELFRAALHRLAGVRYQNDAFYDPVRGEHRQVAFGFLNYSLPLTDDSSRAWRFAWDPIFFEFAQATGGALSFDLSLYRRLDAASRRLYLYLKKVFWRQETSPSLELRHLAVDVLGFSPAIDTRFLKVKVLRCVGELLGLDLLRLPDGCDDPKQLVRKERKGVYTLTLTRGEAFLKSSSSTAAMTSPLADPLASIGFDPPAIARILREYPARAVEQWADITLAAGERHGASFFTSSPQAYFIDNMKAAAKDGRTPPDWWRDMRKQELQQERDRERAKAELLPDTEEAAFEEYLMTEAKDAFGRVMEKLAADLRQGGQTEAEARSNAAYQTRLHFRHRFRRERSSEPSGGLAG